MQSLPLRRAKEWRHYNHTVQHLRPIAGSRGDLLGIVEDASLQQKTLMLIAICSWVETNAIFKGPALEIYRFS